jgi:tetratricopeptide (TPR) repeat protein
MMKNGLLIFLSIIGCLPVFSQVKQNDAMTRPGMVNGNTYAVVIGISNYENESINLNYANRDAQEFAGYLQSKAGGSVPLENIRLLIDTNATTAAIYNALTWLRDKCEADKRENGDNTNQVYFYFSGHGDVETETKASLGFLLCFNTPSNNYLNNAVRIEDLNNYAHTISVDLNANVIIITDACHSGKLAGSNNRGSFLVGKELSTAREKEIRIASCNPDELSNEDLRWGGGRGVFSFYLLNGLKGLADKNGDHIVTLSEIKTYVDSAIANDPIVIDNKLKQTPVLEGNNRFRLSNIDPDALLVVQQSLIVTEPVLSDRDYFFSLLKNNSNLESVDYQKLSLLPKEEIPEAFMILARNILDSSARRDRIIHLKDSILQNKEEMNYFKTALVDLLHTRGQKAINQYLSGDVAELERRRYYNSSNNSYDVYPAMYAVALKLTEPGNPIFQILKVNQLYFRGVAARIKIPLTEVSKQDQLVDTAIASIKEALALSPEAAYIQNEMGILSQLKKEYTEAEKYFLNATLLAPEWAIPWANLCGLYAINKDFEKASEAAKMAENIQPGLQLTSVNMGIENELSGNWLFAEEFYRKAIDINSRHYFPFERLGNVYMNTTNYAQADSFFYEADLRKKGFISKKTVLK